MPESFFLTGKAFLPGLRDDLLGVQINQPLKHPIVLCVLLDSLHLITRHVTTYRFAVLSTLQIVVRPVFPLTHDAQFARLHTFNLRDLLKKPDCCSDVVLHTA